MTEPKMFASLSPSLLARKGGARPAMRPQIHPIGLSHFHDSLARSEVDDLGWNDMGEEGESGGTLAEAEIVPIAAAHAYAHETLKPQVVAQREQLASRVAAPGPRRSALSAGGRAAFTLRVDADRHLKLRLACTISNRSAQQLMTEALDRLLTEYPDVDTLAKQVAKRR
ncbi:MAG: hypothetical protein JF593_09240 [Novosphingobium sp.]|nr:hypothetical protein [Novosphingobium sp.]